MKKGIRSDALLFVLYSFKPFPARIPGMHFSILDTLVFSCFG